LRYLLTAIAVLCALSVSAGLYTPPPAIRAVHTPSEADLRAFEYADSLHEYFAGKGCASGPCADRPWITWVSRETIKAAKFWSIEHTEKKILANFAGESWLDPRALSSAGAWGVAQVHSSTEDYARRMLYERCIEFEDPESPKANIWLGVTIYWMKLKTVNGEPWDAVQRYNGGGKAAVNHRNKIWRMHKDIFG